MKEAWSLKRAHVCLKTGESSKQLEAHEVV